MTNLDKTSAQARRQHHADYKVIYPRELYHGRSYSDWICDWFNWFLSADADKRNLGPVVFLRSHGLPNRLTGAYTPDLPGGLGRQDTLSDLSNSDPSLPFTYVNDPNIMIGGDKLQIFTDQAVFVPIIIAYVFGSKIGEQYIGASYSDLGTLQEYTGLTIDNGDNPPEPGQLTINNRPVTISNEDMIEFRVVTPIFTALVPDVPYGTSIKDFLEEGSVAPGIYPAVVEGYFVMLQFNKPGEYWIHSYASAGREVRGPYFSELVYQLEVQERPQPHGKVTRTRPPRNESIFRRTLSQKMKVGELQENHLTILGSVYHAISKNKLLPSSTEKSD